jgi:DNA-binding transcriptional ArsR family regulator
MRYSKLWLMKAAESCWMNYTRTTVRRSPSCAEISDMTRQAVTKHLGLLETANLVATMWHGREKLHYLNPAPRHEICERWIGKYERHRLQALSQLEKGLEKYKKE